jgi:hypothetical protein
MTLWCIMQVEEVVIVTRSSGAKTFGIVTRVCENGNLDVKVSHLKMDAFIYLWMRA